MNNIDFKKQVGNKKFRCVFTKKDGTERTLIGTTNLELVPDDQHPKGERKILVEGNFIPVFDLEKNGWRSILTDNIKSLEVID